MIKLQQLAHALALRHHGSFNRAARAQHLSQPAFSRSIRSLEDALGVPLFDRQTTAITPTLYGEALLRRAAAVVLETEELEREIALLQGLEAGTLAVAMGAFAAELSGNRAMGELLRRYPHLGCRVSHRSWPVVVEQVLARAVDLGFGEISSLSALERLRVEAVGQHELILYCRRGHPLLGRDSLAKTDLDAYPLALIRVPPRGARLFPGKGHIDAHTGELIPQVEVDDVAAASAIVLASDAFSAATPLQIEPGLRRGEFGALPYQAPWLRLEYGFFYLKDRLLSPAAALFMTIVREIEADLTIRNQALMEQIFSESAVGPGSVGSQADTA